MIAAIYLFLYASQLSFRGNVNLLALKCIQLRELNKQREELNVELKEAQQRYLAEVNGVGGTGRPGEGLVAKQLRDRMDYLKIQLSEMDSRIAKEGNASNEGQKSEISTSQVVTTSVTRFIVLGTVIFPVQILINLYKYNMRIAGHYDAIADTLTLSPESITGERFIGIAELLSTNKIDFGATPHSIIT